MNALLTNKIFIPLPEGEGALAFCKNAEVGEGPTAKNAEFSSFMSWAPHPSLRDTFSLGEKGIKPLRLAA